MFGAMFVKEHAEQLMMEGELKPGGGHYSNSTTLICYYDEMVFFGGLQNQATSPLNLPCDFVVWVRVE